jgi:hypothetical protein
MVDSKVLIHQLRDKDSIAMSGLFHCVPVMRLSAEKIEQLEKALRDAANFIGRWSSVFNAQERTVLTNEFRAAEQAARAALSSPASGEAGK